MDLIIDLALILVTAGVTTILFKWLKQPLVLGYIIAGFLIGPHFPWFPVINETESVEVWSEIGMIFLLFAIGLEFSFKKLKKVGGTVGITALTELVSMCVIGFILGRLLGWNEMECIFLGCMLAMSSTTIIAKAFEDLKMKNEKFTQSVIGVLVVEDLAAILMMVILSTLAMGAPKIDPSAVTEAVGDGGQTGAVGLIFSVVKLIFFLLVWYIGGLFLIPSLLKWARKFMTEETLTIISIGLCFLMVWLAELAGFSSALGAFMMGSILAETLEAEMSHKLTTPIKNLFGAVFFVSVGMMVDPALLVQYWWQILLITVVVLTLKSLSSGIGMLLSGNNLKDSVRAGVCFGQIGEFSFIIATVGMKYGVIHEWLYPIIVSVSIVTTFITPYSIKAGIPIFNWLDHRIPNRWKDTLSNKEKGMKVKNGETITMSAFLIRQLKNIVIYASLTVALLIICKFFCNFILIYLPSPLDDILSAAITLLVVSPLLWAMAFKHSVNYTTHKLMEVSKLNKNIVIFVFLLRFLLVFGFIFLILVAYLDYGFWSSLGIGHTGAAWLDVAIAVTLSFLLRVLTPAMRWYKKLEERFMDNFNKRQTQQSFVIPEILQENFTLEKMTLGVDSPYVGQIIAQTDFRDNYNINIVSVERGDEAIDLPDRDFMLFPYDEITFVGTEQHLALLKSRVETQDQTLIKERPESDVHIHRIDIAKDSYFAGRKLRESEIRERHNAMVIAIERDGDFILNPSADIVFLANDIVWFVATSEKMKTISQVIKDHQEANKES